MQIYTLIYTDNTKSAVRRFLLIGASTKLGLTTLGVVPEAGVEPARIIHPTDFKSVASSDSATRASHLSYSLPVYYI